MRALVLAGGEVPDRTVLDAAWPGWAEGIGIVVAADGGVRHAARLGVPVHVWIGDGDSTEPASLDALEAAGVEIRRVATDKDESDTELAMRSAAALGVVGIVVLGATGGPRIDHELANLALLAGAAIDAAEVDVVVLTPHSRIRLAHGGRAAMALSDRIGDLVSLLPFEGPADGVVTTGLQYPLRGERLPVGTPRGLSNVVVAGDASVALERGSLLVIETPGTIGR
jgi:thiamine pyrophosphokinase